MKKLFRKAVTVLGSAALIGATVGMAAAASYPEPFTSNTAIVVGANAAPSDNIAAASIASNLDANAASAGTVTVADGEAFALEKSSDNFNFGDALSTIYSTLDSEDMDFLADGTYDDGDVDEDYEQTISLGTKTLGLFADNDYNDDEPTVGFRWTNGEKILSYTLEFDNEVPFADMEETDMPLMGKEYYVLSAAVDAYELLDSAEKTVITEGETVTVNGKTVSIEFVDDTYVKFNVNGEITDKLAGHGYEELDDGSYIVANEILYSAKETGVSKVEFSIGAGKLTLEEGQEVEVNDETVDELVATFTDSATGVTSITLTWNSDDETFVGEGESITMPAFESISLIYNGMDYASSSETISVDNGETLVLNMENYDLPIAWFDGTDALPGEEDYLLILETGASTVNYTATGAGEDSPTGGIEVAEDNRFIVTSIDTDLSDIETAYYEVTSIDYNAADDFEVTLSDLIGDNDLTFDALEDHDRGDINIELVGINGTNVAYFTFTAVGDIAYNKAVSDKGLIVTLPSTTDIEAVTDTVTAEIVFQEADKDEDLGSGEVFNAVFKASTNDKLYVSTTNVTTEEASSDNFIGYVDSDLASVVTTDESGDEYDFSIEYFGKEATAEVIIATGATSTSTTDAGVMTVKDSEVATVASKNLVVVGGSAINSVAAELLGGAYGGDMFTSATGVEAGAFLIQSFERSTGKTALLVAGYNAADTEKAVTYLLNNDVDTTVGSKLRGTSATEATVVTA